MKIAFLIDAVTAVGNPGNGVAIQAKSQAKALANLGHEVVLLNPWERQEVLHFDVIHFFYGGPNLSGIEGVSKKMGPGVLIYAPIIDINVPNLVYRMAAGLGGLLPKFLTNQGEYRKQALASDAVVCRSVHEQERVIKGLGIAAERTAIVLNGIDIPEKASDDADVWKRLRERCGLDDDFILHVSRYTSPRKNVARLVEAVGPLGHPLVIAGFTEAGALLRRINQLAGKYPQIKLLGFLTREELAALYARCRVFCLPSIHEGTGLVALEAAAYGANIVITKYGGPPDYLGSNAIYVNPYRVSEIREGAAYAWETPRSDRLRRHLFANLTWEHSARSLLVTYQKALARKSGQVPGAP